MINKRGQSTLEYLVYMTVIIAVFVTVSTYFKRGVAGRWKAAADDVGDQYDPRTAESNVLYTVKGESATILKVIETKNGQYTERTDLSNMIETKTGNTVVR
ncbi:MAG: hypothetical protein HQL26_10390 [Candidatus Omnitrophica bacterium]|nr:hypothetical protein [Candidatus Omnitrophota bacterium]